MDLYIFECSLDAGANVITADPHPASIPADATAKLCRGASWILMAYFAAGDGTYPAAREDEIKQAIQANGYYWVIPTDSV
jgi:hypothetical protein